MCAPARWLLRTLLLLSRNFLLDHRHLRPYCCCCSSHYFLHVFLKCAGFVVLSDAVRGFLHKIHVFIAVSYMLYTACIERRLWDSVQGGIFPLFLCGAFYF